MDDPSDLLCFWGILGTFNFWVQGGGRKILDASLGGGGANKIERVIWGANEIGPSVLLDSLGAK